MLAATEKYVRYTLKFIYSYAVTKTRCQFMTKHCWACKINFCLNKKQEAINENKHFFSYKKQYAIVQ